MKDYNNFILERITNQIKLILEGYLYASPDFMERLNKLKGVDGKTGFIAKNIYDFINLGKHVDNSDIAQNFFDVTDKIDMVSFIMNNRLPDDWDPDLGNSELPYSMARSDMKIGKIVRYLMNIINKINPKIGNISDSELESFVNSYKSMGVDDNWVFMFVNGNDIAKYYNSDKYHNMKGTLGSSCMAEKGKRTFKIYTKNKSKVRLLVLIDKETDKICGRALVWKLKKSPCDAKFFMDRVYTNNDYDLIKFKNFAEEEGFLYKKSMNSYTNENVNFIFNGKDVSGEITVKLDGDVDKTPWLDTLCFLNKDMDSLSNLSSKKCYFLHTTDGEMGVCGDCNRDCIVDGDICEFCSDGHITLMKMGIETPINRRLRRR